MLAKIERPSSTAATIEAKLSSVRTMSAAPFETSVPVIPIATPMSAALQRRRVVHAVAGHRHDPPVRLERAARSAACARARPARTPSISRTTSRRRGVVGPLQLRRRSPRASPGGDDPDLGRDGRRRGRVVAGDHDRADAGLPRQPHRRRAPPAAAGRSCRRCPARPAPRSCVRRPAPSGTRRAGSVAEGHAERPQRLARPAPRSSGRIAAPPLRRQRPRLAADPLVRAARQQDVGRALGEHVRRVRRPLGVEVRGRSSACARRRTAPRRRARSARPGLAAPSPTLRAATSSAPSVGSPRTVQPPLLLAGARRCSPARARRQRRARAPRRSVGSVERPRRRAAPRRPARSRSRSGRSRPLGGDDDAHGHLVAGQRAGLVGADHGGRAERLDRRQLADDHVARCAIRCIPSESTIVVTAVSPSGTAATASETASSSTSTSAGDDRDRLTSAGSSRRRRPRSRSRAIAEQPADLVELALERGRFGLGLLPASRRSCPARSRAPVATTTARPRPAATAVPLNTMLSRSPMPTSSAIGRGRLRGRRCSRRSAPPRPSAARSTPAREHRPATVSPSSSSSMSPGTRSPDGTSCGRRRAAPERSGRPSPGAPPRPARRGSPARTRGRRSRPRSPGSTIAS